MKLIMLGTGHATVTDIYNTCFLLNQQDDYFLIDGGGGNTILSQLKKASIDWKKIQTIFVTHKHLDHFMGILWMIRMICQSKKRGQHNKIVTIYACQEVISLIELFTGSLLLETEACFLNKEIILVPVADGDEYTILNKKVVFFDIQSTKTIQYGFCMYMENNKKLTCLGDEPYRSCEYSYVKNCNWLLHEAFCLYSEKNIFNPYEKYHSTVKDACEIAAKLEVENLILYHTEDSHIKTRRRLYKKEGMAYYNGNLFIPKDLDVIDIE